MDPLDEEKLERAFAHLRGPGPSAEEKAELARRWPGMLDAAEAEARRRARKTRTTRLLLLGLVAAAILVAVGASEPVKVAAAKIEDETGEAPREDVKDPNATPPEREAALRDFVYRKVAALLETDEQRKRFLELVRAGEKK